jgi:hypothetical protein
MKSSESSPGPIRRVLSALSPDCKEASRRQSEAVHHPLPLGQRVGLRIHLLLCKWCRRYGKNLRFLQHVVEHPAEHDCAEHATALGPEARERMKQKLTTKSNYESCPGHD